jgi:hypothetical protein
MARKNVRAAKMAAKLDQVVSSAKRAAQARTQTKASAKSMRKLIEDNRRKLESLGKKETVTNGVMIYATKPVAIEVKQSHAKGAKRQRDNECPIARALRDSFLGAHITDAHVGNTTVKMWSDLNPDIEVKYLLDFRLYGAVKTFDRTGRWPLKDGIYWLNIYPPSLRRGYVPRDPGSRIVMSHKRSPSRHISLRSDLGRARAAADSVVKRGKKRA